MDTIITPTDYTLTNTIAVLPDRLVHDATVVVRDGVLVEVVSGSRPDAIDVGGSFTMPGIVDTHSDGLEKELRPRPGVMLPMDFALRSFEGRVRGAGVTTIFHGVGYSNSEKYDRTVAQALDMSTAIDERAASGQAIVDHRVLHRLDVRDPEGLAALSERIEQVGAAGGERPLVSYEDHTPGRGQYADRRWFERYIAGTRDMSPDEAKTYIDNVAAERDAQLVHRDAAIPWLGEQTSAGRIDLMVHDPADPDEVDESIAVGATISEFPTTVAAAEASRDRSLRTVCGAPNALRGESHSGNVSARELVALGLCDGLASDYMPSTLLGAVAVLVDEGICDLPTAAALVTSGPARTAGLTDRGRLEAGQRGDLVVFDLDGRLPTVRLAVSQAAIATSWSTPEAAPARSYA